MKAVPTVALMAGQKVATMAEMLGASKAASKVVLKDDLMAASMVVYLAASTAESKDCYLAVS